MRLCCGCLLEHCCCSCSAILKQIMLLVIADCSTVNKRQSVMYTDEIQAKIADLGNACWTVSYSNLHSRTMLFILLGILMP